VESTPHGRLPCGSAPFFGGGLARRCSRPREHSARRRRAALGVCCISSRAACLLCGCGHEGEWPANVVCAQRRSSKRPSPHGGPRCSPPGSFSARVSLSGVQQPFFLQTADLASHGLSDEFVCAQLSRTFSQPPQERDPGMGEATRFLLLWEARGHFWAAAIFLSTAWVSRTDVSAPSVKRRAAARKARMARFRDVSDPTHLWSGRGVRRGPLHLSST